VSRKLVVEGLGTIGLLIEHPDSDEDYIVPPVVFGTDGELLMGAEVLEAIVQSGVSVETPVIRNCTAAQLARIDQLLAKISTELGVPVSTV